MQLAGGLFVADHLCAALAIVEVVRDAHHAHGAHVVCRCGFHGAGAPHAAQDLDRGHGALHRVHAGSVAGGRDGGGEVGVGGGAG